jgi:putative SOS response-associated peptidase YedK
MCGRYSLFTPPDTIESAFDAAFDQEFEPRYNAAPSQSLPVIADTDHDTIGRMEWGFVPTWADDRSEFEFINARAETLAEKPSFEAAFEGGLQSAASGGAGGTVTAGRCLVPADGFYEWTDVDGETRPYRVTLTDERPFAMAGLWARWTPSQTQTGLDAFGGGGADGAAADPQPVETFAIVTTEPNAVVAELHHRMAVMLDPGEADRWLTAAPDEAAAMLDPYPAAEMRAYPVSTAVNDPSNDRPVVAEEIDAGAGS